MSGVSSLPEETRPGDVRDDGWIFVYFEADISRVAEKLNNH